MKEGIMKKILITDNKKAREFSQLFYPRIIVSRAECTSLDVSEIGDVWLDGTDTDTLNIFTSAQSLSYAKNPLDFEADIDTIRAATKAMESYTIPPAPAEPAFKIEDDFITGKESGNLPALPLSPSDSVSQEIPLYEQIALLEPLLEGKRIGAGTVAVLTAQLADLCKNNGLFLRDEITGLYKSCFCRRPLISAEHAYTIFATHFCDKLAIQSVSYKTDKNTGETKRDIKYRNVKIEELKLLWKNVGLYSTFNSRKEFYDAIPEWDGEERIATFMKKYFECNTNPKFFLLLMTCIIAKMVNSRIHTPYFFDFVASAKGIGKSLLCRRLLNGKYCGFLRMSRTRGMSDFFVDAYDGNNILVVDDECTWCGTGGDRISYDEFKALVTSPTDKFSRKMQQPEEHDRSFIILRTSNYANQVFSTNERRQIIFECGLAEQECRILDLPDSFFEQMLAEAKDYFVKHGGIYELQPEDKLDIKEANKNNFNYETEENFTILDYVRAVRNEPDKWGCSLLASKFGENKWGNYKKYVEWCNQNHRRAIISRAFWRNVSALSELPENFMAVISEQKYQLSDGGKCRVFRVDPVTVLNKPEDEMPDLPY